MTIDFSRKLWYIECHFYHIKSTQLLFFYGFIIFPDLCFVSHSALFGYFQTLPGIYSSRKPPKSWKSTCLWTLPPYYKITQVATTCCTSLNFEHFLFRIATSRCSLSHILHFSGTFEHFRQEIDSEHRRIHPESWRKYPPLNTFHLSGSAFTATRMFRASFHS